MSGRFSYIKYDQQAIDLQEAFKKKFEEVESMVASHLPQGRPSSLVLTKIEEAYMWVGKSIRDMQIARAPEASPEQPERANV